MIRLGEGVDASGVLADGAIERLICALQTFQGVMDSWSVSECVVAGTSASRDTGNRIVEIVRERTGLDYKILSGEQEADLSFEGAVGGLPEITDQVITCDIGGGSTEIVKGMSDGRIFQRFSLDIGSVRITERFFSSQPPSPGELNKARGFIQQSLAALLVSDSQIGILVGASDVHRLLLELQHELVAGVLPIQLDQLNPNWIRLQQKQEYSERLSLIQVRCWTELLSRMTKSDVFAIDPGKLQGRDDVFPAAILIFLEVMKSLGQESITVSQWGLCHGMALRYFKNEGIQ